jgi:CBS domain-containing protein
MTTVAIAVTPSTPVSEARELMRRKRIRHLLVTEEERLVGIITDRDIRLNLPSPASSLSVWEVNYLITKLTVGEAMTRSLITIRPDRPVAEAVRLMLEHKIGALPVTENERVVGIITETDLLQAFARMLGEPVVRTMKTEFYCPWVHQNVAVRFLTLDKRRPVGVMSCTAFEDPEEVMCAMPCLTREERADPEKDHVLDLLNE